MTLYKVKFYNADKSKKRYAKIFVEEKKNSGRYMFVCVWNRNCSYLPGVLTSLNSHIQMQGMGRLALQ